MIPRSLCNQLSSKTMNIKWDNSQKMEFWFFKPEFEILNMNFKYSSSVGASYDVDEYEPLIKSG